MKKVIDILFSNQDLVNKTIQIKGNKTPLKYTGKIKRIYLISIFS